MSGSPSVHEFWMHLLLRPRVAPACNAQRQSCMFRVGWQVPAVVCQCELHIAAVAVPTGLWGGGAQRKTSQVIELQGGEQPAAPRDRGWAWLKDSA